MDRNQMEQRLKAWLEEKRASKCPLCGEESWDFGDLRQVFLIGAAGGAEIGKEVQRGISAPRRFEPQRQLRELRNQLRAVRNSATINRLLQLTCNHCGHVVLLHAAKILRETEEGGHEPPRVHEGPEPQIS